MNATNAIRTAVLAATMIALPILGATAANAAPAQAALATIATSDDGYTVLDECTPGDDSCQDDTPWG